MLTKTCLSSMRDAEQSHHDLRLPDADDKVDVL
jgi:hypothetical protein